MINSVFGIYKNYKLVKNNSKKELNAKVEEKFLAFKNLDGISSSYRPIFVTTGQNEQYEKGRQLTKKM